MRCIEKEFQQWQLTSVVSHRGKQTMAWDSTSDIHPSCSQSSTQDPSERGMQQYKQT